MGLVPDGRPLTPEEQERVWRQEREVRQMMSGVPAPAKRKRQRPELFPIGTHRLRGSLRGDLVTIAGPCGEGHIMSRAAAKELEDWLHRVLAGEEPGA